MDDLLQKWINKLDRALEVLEEWNEGKRDTIGEAFEIISEVIEDMGETKETIIRVED